MATNLQFIKKFTASSGVSYLDTPDLFTASYDVYFWTITKFDVSADEVFEMKLLDSSNSVIESNYYWASLQLKSNTSFNEANNTNRPKIDFIAELDGDSEKCIGVSGYVYNPNDSSSYTYGTVQSSSMDGTNLFGSKGMWSHQNAEQINGLRLAAQFPVTISTLEVSFFGVK
jgi:hypothetical protein